MSTHSETSPEAVLKRLHAAFNQHDIEAFMACFASDYQSEQPVYPDRTFQGSDQVRKNWSAMFTDIPDFQASLLQSTVDGDVVWAEWQWLGTQAGGGNFQMRGVTLFGVAEGKLIWGRLYMYPVQEHGAGIDAAVKGLTRGAPGQHKRG